MNVARLPIKPPGGRAPKRFTLVNGADVLIRPLRCDDAPRLRRMYERCSAETIYRRFMTPVPRFTDRMLRILVDVDGHDREALCATTGDEIIAVARYHRTGATEAEFAVEVEDAWHRLGLGRLLSRLIGERARANGIAMLVGAMLADNVPAKALLRAAFPGIENRVTAGEITFRVPLDPAARRSAVDVA
jgi:GNAT superfamily N-acetyltransferase